MTAPTWSAVDSDTADILDTVNADWLPFAPAERIRIAAAIRSDAATHDGSVSPNRVRAALAALPVAEQPKPQRVGPVYRALCLAGMLQVDGWETSTDRHGRNSGKPSRRYRWIGWSL